MQLADQRFGLFVGEFEGPIPERGVVNQQSLVTRPGRARCVMIFLCFPEPASRSSPLLRLRLKTTAPFFWPGAWYIDLNCKRPILQWDDPVDYLNNRTRPT